MYQDTEDTLHVLWCVRAESLLNGKMYVDNMQ